MTYAPEPVSVPSGAPITVVPPLVQPGWPRPGVPVPPQRGYQVPPQPGRQVPDGYPRQEPTAPNGAPLATFVERLGAYVLDRVIIGGIAVIPTVVLMVTLLVPPLLDDVRAQQAAGTRVPTVNVEHFFLRYLLVLACGIAFQVVVGVLYEVLYQAGTGQTVGKRVMGIRTIQVDGGALTRGSATKRYLTQLGCSLVPGLAYVDGLWQLWDKPLRQCLHDKAAQTVVVKV